MICRQKSFGPVMLLSVFTCAYLSVCNNPLFKSDMLALGKIIIEHIIIILVCCDYDFHDSSFVIFGPSRFSM